MRRVDGAPPTMTRRPQLLVTPTALYVHGAAPADVVPWTERGRVLVSVDDADVVEVEPGDARSLAVALVRAADLVEGFAV
ncbi:MAG: hypothetical protein ACJ74O_01540 [Frankiaceae bacterium]